jgi:conjugative relaxase-like TrwC/TraI family protein
MLLVVHADRNMVLIVNRLGETAGRYYFDGDSPGRWCGAARHDLGLDGVVDRRDLDAVLQGRHPAGNERLEDRPRSHRRAGWDLILTAPKSVSLLAAMAPPDVGDALESAHRRACADAFGWLETHGCWARRRSTGLVATSGLIAARFGHTTSAAGDPHLHTHVLVANVVRAGDGRWSALDGSGVWLNRRTVGAVYHLALRQQTLAAGLRLRWDVHPDGSADVADVPRAAIDATSSRHRQIQERLDRGGDPSLRGRTAAQRLSRAEPAPTTRWEDRTELAGFGARAAARVLDDAMDRATPAPGAGQGALAGDVVRWLADRRSTFGLADVMQAVAASHPEGTGAATADEWARTFCDRSPRTADGRWTSALAMGRDEALVRAATARVHVDVGPARPAGGAGRGEPGPTPRLHDPVEGEKADPGVRLTTAGRGIDVLGSPLRRDPGDGWRVIGSMGGFVAQAEILGAARVEWQQSGRRVAVLTPSDDAARRWRALARPPTGGRPVAGRPRRGSCRPAADR